MPSRRTLSMFVAVMATLSPAAAFAQDRPVAFVHGINSSGATWVAAAARLQEKLAIVADAPSLSSRALYETQTSELQSAIAHRDDSLITVGHSNGGIVSRALSRRRPVSGIVTVGTAHSGAPLVSNIYAMAGFNGQMIGAMNDVYRAFANGCCDWHWILTEYNTLFQLIVAAANESVWRVGAALALNATAPVTFEMQPGSVYLSELNNPANLGREVAAVPGRLGIVATAYNFYWGGPLRAAFPEQGDALYFAREALRIGMETYAAYVYARAPFEQWWAFDIADGMLDVAGWLGQMDAYWCAVVSDPNRSACYPNDTIVPGWSQVYPAGGLIDTGWSGPAHTQQTSLSDALIEQALTVYMSVRPRGANPPGPQSPARLYDDVTFEGAWFDSGADSAFVGWDWNDRVSSIHVPAGRTVTLFEHADFGGESLTLTGDAHDLRQYAGPGVDGTWNDVASSIRVR